MQLPPVFSQYRPRYLQRVSDTEFSSACLLCGGEVHPDGSWPDRCRWFLSGKELGWCRRCNHIFWPDQADGYQPPSPEEKAVWKRQQEQQEEARKRSAELALKNLRSEKLWEQYYNNLKDAGRKYWRNRGLADCFIDFWMLGWRDDWKLRRQDGTYQETESATIPLFDHTGEAQNIKHRLITPVKGKYLYQYQGLTHPLFLCDYEKPIEGEIIAVEGEIKAAVTFQTLDDATITVVGIPGITPSGKIISQLQQADKIILVTDPGSRQQTWNLCKKIGTEKVKVLIPAQKIDDAIIESGMTKRELKGLLRNAVPAA